jgi:hypothetical protein
VAPDLLNRDTAVPMDDLDKVIEEALQAAGRLPSPPAFRAWCAAYLAGRSQEEEAVKRAFRAVWTEIAGGRFDDFMRQLAIAETRRSALRREEVASWAHAAAARAVLETILARRLQSSEAAREKWSRAAEMAAAALRFAQAATS